MIVRDGRLVSSYSQLEKYINCPKSWYFQYVLKMVDSDEPKLALEYGLAVHETLEEYFKAKQDGKSIELSDLESSYDFIFNAHDIPFLSDEQKIEYKQAGVEMVRRLYNPQNEVERLLADEDTEILGVELPFEVPIKLPFEVVYDDVVYDTVFIIGFIDLVLRTKDGIIIIDHKSGKTLFDKTKLDNNFQFPIYAMAIKQIYNELPVKCYYNFTKLHKCQIVSFGEERLEATEKEIVKIFKKMYKSKHTAKPSFLCYWCDFGKYNSGYCKFSSDFKPKYAK